MGDQKLPACFQVIADVHIKDDDLENPYAVSLVKGLKDMKDFAPDSLAVLTLGDFTQSGTEKQFDGFYKIIEQYGPVADEGNIIALGNHDVRGNHYEDWNLDETVVSSHWPEARQLYQEHNRKYMPENCDTLYFDRWLGGYHFIILNTENGLKDTMYLSDEQLHWLETTLAEGASWDKPIFVMGHNALKDTHWRSNVLWDFGGQNDRVKEIFSKYPQTIYFSGHIHNGLGVAEAVEREYGTMVDVPSYNCTENGVMDVGTGYHVEVYEGAVVLRARNFKTSAWLPEYDIRIQTPSLAAVYGKANQLLGDGIEDENLVSALEEAKQLMNRQYDQNELDWDETLPPESALYSPDVRKRINALAEEIVKELI